jgi:hypothetical protein
MVPYWILFVLAAMPASTHLKPALESATRWSFGWRFIFVVLVLMIGLRHQVGGDWGNYAEHLSQAFYDTLETGSIKVDPAYRLLNLIGAQMGVYGIYFVNTVCAILFTWGLVLFCRAQPLPWLTLLVAVPYLITVVAMGYTRQGVAIGLVMAGIQGLVDRKYLRFAVLIALAATFHRSAVILMPLVMLADTRNRLRSALWVPVVTLILFVLLLQDSVEDLRVSYIEKGIESSGATIRVMMNAVPAVLFLWFRRNFALKTREGKFWTWMSLAALAQVFVLMYSPSSTALDRVALYWIPLQLFVFSRLPIALGQRTGRKAMWVRSVIGYSAAVLFVWLFFAVNAFAWLPYQFYPWVLFSQ